MSCITCQFSDTLYQFWGLPIMYQLLGLPYVQTEETRLWTRWMSLETTSYQRPFLHFKAVYCVHLRNKTLQWKNFIKKMPPFGYFGWFSQIDVHLVRISQSCWHHQRPLGGCTMSLPLWLHWPSAELLPRLRRQAPAPKLIGFSLVFVGTKIMVSTKQW